MDEPYGRRLDGPDAVEAAARILIGSSAQEHFCVFFLDVRNRIIGFSEAGRGAVDSCPVDPRQVFRAALVAGASSIIISHNHPSGDATPSAADILLTDRLGRGATLLGLELLDHVIVTDSDSISFRATGRL